MSTNDFVTSLKIGNVGKSKSKKLQELRLETMHLEMENQDMEQKLSQLRLNMDKEKEERQLSSGFRWKSGQVGSLNYTGQGLYQNKENAVKDYSGKMKFKVLKDSIPETGKQPAGLKPSFMASIEKPKTKGKACGQCENRNAVLSCLECGEDYCVCCFTKFHQKGALKLHRTSPIPGKYTAIGKLDAAQQFKKEIDLSLLKLDTKKERTNSPLFSKNLSSSEIGQSYSTEVKDVPIGKLDATQQFKKDIDLSLMKHDTRKERSNSPLLSKNLSPPGIVQSYSVESVSTLSTNPGNEKVPGGSLLHGTFNEDQSSKSFKEILAEWRKTNPEPKPKLKSSEDVPGTDLKEGFSFSCTEGNQPVGLSVGRSLDSALPKPDQDFKFKVETILRQDDGAKTKIKSLPLRAEQLVLEGQRNCTDVIIDSINGLRRMTHSDSSTQNQSMLEMCRSIDTLGSNIGELAKHLISIQNQQTNNSKLISWAICKGIELLGIHSDFANPPINSTEADNDSVFPLTRTTIKDSSTRHASPPRRLRRARVSNQLFTNQHNVTSKGGRRKKDKI